MEPVLGQIPVVDHRSPGNFQYFRRVVDAEAAKETEFHYLALALIDSGKPVQSIVQRQDLAVAFGRDGQWVIE